IDSIELNTNEYGSYSGKFVLPQGTLNGIFTLRDINIKGNTSFSMEEYKRPVFSVEYETIKGSYKVNDSVSIIGFAKAYAGNNIDGAQIKFRVQRVARFIYPWLYWKWGYPRANNIEITNGVTTTDAEGKFKITFKAIPDLTINKDLEPVFDYKINADITDINGETRSGETTVPVAYKALQLNIGLEDGQNIIADSLKNISISTKNIAGTPEPALITMIISKLQSPDRLIRERYWQQPDQFVLNKEEFRKTFPNDEYSDESNFRSWAKDKAIFTSADSSNDNSKFKIQNLEFVEGWYAIEAITKDKYGAEVKDIKYIQLYDERSKFLPYTAYKWSSQKNNTIEPGEQSTITIGSAANDVFLIQEIDKPVNQPSNPAAIDNNTISTKYNFINLTGKQSFTFTATEEDRGGFGIYHFFVKNNRFYSLSNNINIPWTNKDLQISYESFRDKTLPGSDEKWKLKINGYKNEKVAAEMLATMYDASLDQLKPNSWDIPDPWENYYPTKIWAGHNNFNQVQSQIKYLDDELKVFYKHYDELMTQSGQPLWWTTPLDYVYDEVNAPRYMKLSSPLINDASLYKGNKIGYKKENVATYLNAGTDTYTTQTEMFVHANIMKKI
ncbi:MAG TPA: hypothetical protein VKI61_01975, partial [Chitinophagaceae bacterium]|nr:hypothetical protein [Chitinophagaceae bacterium]